MTSGFYKPGNKCSKFNLMMREFQVLLLSILKYNIYCCLSQWKQSMVDSQQFKHNFTIVVNLQFIFI